MPDETKTEMIAGKERLLCYAGAILAAYVANPQNTYSWEKLRATSIEQAKLLIKEVYES